MPMIYAAPGSEKSPGAQTGPRAEFTLAGNGMSGAAWTARPTEALNE